MSQRRSSAPPQSPTKRKRPRPRSSRPPRVSTAAPRSKRKPRRALTGLVAAVLAVLLVLLSPLWIWSRLGGPGGGKIFAVQIKDESGLADLLVERGALSSPAWFKAYLTLLEPGFELVPGEHLLDDAASPHDLIARLGRGSGRSSERVTLPEGWQSLQIGQRLERAGVCSQLAFRAAVSDAALLRELGVEGPSAEGYLFPASYGLLADSDGREVVRVLVAETKKRLAKLFAAHPGRLEQLGSELGFHERDVLTLASMIEKEARAAEERPLIASVFFNRLRDAEFRPARMLQSDPTASYGCLIAPANIPSCEGFHGTVTPALLRDALNPYNTYRHPGLPPGPIANPGEPSIEAVLAPAQTDYLYFVAKGGGQHAFSRTFAEHREALESPH